MKTESLIYLTIMLFFLGCAKDGKDGKMSLIDMKVEPKGLNCDFGGLKVTSGIDLNDNGVLESNEVNKTEYVCSSKIDSIYDKQTRITFPIINDETTSKIGYINMLQCINDFNVSNYLKADSIVFGLFSSTLNTQVPCVVELYDITNNKVINNSKIETNSMTDEWRTTSKNLINEFPKETIKLGIRLTSKSSFSYETSVSYSSAMIIIYRK
jgi:hypothetical protein